MGENVNGEGKSTDPAFVGGIMTPNYALRSDELLLHA